MRTKEARMVLDRIDCGILAALQNDGRLSNKELAALVGLAPSSCLARVRRLREGGALRGVHADVDPAAVGVAIQAMIALRMRDHSRASADALWEHLAALPETVSLYNLSGADDFLVHVAVRDVDHLRRLAWDTIAVRPEVGHIETSVIFEHHARRALPIYVEPAE
jgi:DNA-binding Lrp family transcriptional regulator